MKINVRKTKYTLVVYGLYEGRIQKKPPTGIFFNGGQFSSKSPKICVSFVSLTVGSLLINEGLSDYCSKCRIGKLEFQFASHKIPDTFMANLKER